MTKNERFKKALDWLYAEGLIDDQQELSSKTGINEATISRILNNKVRQPSTETIRKLTSRFRNIDPAFLRGESDSVTFQPPAATQQQSLPAIDPSSELNAALSAYVQLTNRLTDDLKRKEQELSDRLAEKDARIESLERTIADKEELIRSRDYRIKELDNQLEVLRSTKITNYPFPKGVADENKKRDRI